MNRLIAWHNGLFATLLGRLDDEGDDAFADHHAPARRLDHPTYLRRGIVIAGVMPPVADAAHASN